MQTADHLDPVRPLNQSLGVPTGKETGPCSMRGPRHPHADPSRRNPIGTATRSHLLPVVDRTQPLRAELARRWFGSPPGILAPNPHGIHPGPTIPLIP